MHHLYSHVLFRYFREIVLGKGNWIYFCLNIFLVQGNNVSHSFSLAYWLDVNGSA